jgi:hypothetical protein
MDLQVDSANNRNEYQKISGAGKARPARKADKLTAISEPIFNKMWILDVSQPYRPPRPVTGTASLFFLFSFRSSAVGV